MEISAEVKNGKQVIKIGGKLDTNTASEFESFCKELLEKEHMSVVLECTDLDYISSAGLRVVLLIGKKLKTEQKSLVLACLTDFVTDVFKMSGFDKFFKIYGTLDEALGAE